MTESINVSLQIWDIDGGALTGKMMDTYVHDANAIVFVYDVTNLESYESIEFWVREVTLVSKTSPDKEPPIRILFGNKADLNHLSKVDNDNLVAFSKQHRMTPYLGSAKTGDQVFQMFYKLAADLSGVKVTKAQVEAQQRYQPAMPD